jgi:hypothetical protein
MHINILKHTVFFITLLKKKSRKKQKQIIYSKTKKKEKKENSLQEFISINYLRIVFVILC